MKLIAALAALSLVVSACGESDEQLRARTAKINAELARTEAVSTAEYEGEFEKKTNAELIAMLGQCKQLILSFAREQYRPFEPFMVDQYSADTLQAATYASGGRVQKESEEAKRVKKYRELSAGQPNASLLDTSYNVMITRDTFNGPQRESKEARCTIERGIMRAHW